MVPNMLPTQFGVVHTCVELKRRLGRPGVARIRAVRGVAPNEAIVALHDVSVGGRHEHPAQGAPERVWLRAVMSV